MAVQKLTTERLNEFLSFCRTHRAEVDESFLYDEDLRDFVLDDENPTYVAVAPTDAIMGAASVMNGALYRRGRKGRFRIFHVLSHDREVYGQLLASVRRDVPDLDDLYVFVREDNARVRNVLESIDFQVERHACVMVRDPAPVEKPDWEEGYVLRPMVFNRDEEDYCHVRNLGFAHLTGSETPITPDEVSRMKDSDAYIESGVFLLYHHGHPVGVVRTSEDIHEDKRVVSIGPLALVPGYQGRGLGRQLLRAALSFGRDKGLLTAVLSANADNENAVRLYVSEGFQTVEGVVCYNYRLPT